MNGCLNGYNNTMVLFQLYVETKMHLFNGYCGKYKQLMNMIDFLVHKQRTYVKNQFVSASSL